MFRAVYLLLLLPLAWLLKRKDTGIQSAQQNTRDRSAPAPQEFLNARPFLGAPSMELHREVSAQQPTPGFLPGKSHGQGSPVGYNPWGRRVGHTTE